MKNSSMIDFQITEKSLFDMLSDPNLPLEMLFENVKIEVTTAMTHPVIYFDGECNLCNGFVLYVIKHDREGKFRFSSLQSEFARKRGFTIPKTSDGSLETMVVEWDGRILKYATGVLRVLESLGGWHRFFKMFWVVPRALRDAVYLWCAKRRYFFFGRAETCMVPTPELQARFLG